MTQSKFNTETLKLTRFYYGLSQTAFAKKLNTTQSKLSQFENGEKLIDEKFLQQIKNLENDFLSVFFTKKIYTPAQQLFYRKLVSVSKTMVSKFEARLAIVARVIEELLEEVEFPQNRIKAIDAEDFNFNFEYIAEQTRLSMGHLRGPINDIIKLLEANGVIIHFFDFDFISESNNKFDGVSTYVSGVPVIMINNKIPNSRKVFTIAHELGHLILHFDHIIHPSRDIEREANQFAAAFLAPYIEIKGVFKRFNIDKLFSLKSEWKMSAASILYRAKEIGNINDDWYQKCMFWLSKYRKKEPYEFDLSEPKLLKTMIKLTQDADIFSFRENIGLSENTVNEIFGTILPKKETKLKLHFNFDKII
ncbi:XRE family transcriptional regulator [Riemerella anatipestifer]|uniref:XRE family transcriptional regulator n=1 Tax=Riemerella anatipestifer TaxID=34085 RepID=UPI001BD919D2|nr:XRE family transcriptional regulator [Riemerella anatipestifer]MBT0552555.1 ImmA/IrrE family metallo-endopeptidase [Riemerella anatipestifer]MBT0554240.1 ImmA/IrrE family metallo-endopeptidase [Riemerella anatipestifer]MDY3449787.1 XRE family transcriptional regulator [Riemerella anatipestifer]QYR03390.1 ImmA/IrrE family metallo-endopeptidase [Riemerella anatipestifer]QYR05658.1 ImmA/IrrE family metallo-endopeptidase [Riemerella anatipestifer]